MKLMVIKIETYHKIKPYLRKIVSSQLTIGISFISSKDVEEEHVMHANSGNVKLTP